MCPVPDKPINDKKKQDAVVAKVALQALHDVEGVMSCFHENPCIEDAEGKCFEGRDTVRRNYETAFAAAPRSQGTALRTGGWRPVLQELVVAL